MKSNLIKFITAIASAVVCTLSTMYSTVYAVTRVDVPQIYSLENFFNVLYGDKEENVTAGALDPGVPAEMVAFDKVQEVKGDINGNFKTNTADAVVVLKFCAGM